MAFNYSFFNSINGDRIYNADDWAAYFATFIGNGIFQNPTAQLQVVPSSGLTIRVNTGKTFINGYYGNNTSNENINLTSHLPTTNSRIVRIVVRLDMVGRQIVLDAKPGTQASNPTAPALTRNATIYELALADIRLSTNTTSITASLITDTRSNSSLCGWVSGTVSQINTTGLFQQFQDSFDTWFANVVDTLDGDVAGNLQNQINNLDANKATKDVATLISNGLMSFNDKAAFEVLKNDRDKLKPYFVDGQEELYEPTLLNGVQPYSGEGSHYPQIRKIGKMIYFEGSLTDIFVNDTVCFELPARFRPARTSYFTCVTSTVGGKSRSCRFIIGTSGQCRMQNTSDGIVSPIEGTLFSLSGISYSVSNI